MYDVASPAPDDAPAPASRAFEIALALAFSRLEARRRLELEPPIAAAFERRAGVLRAALASPIAGEALADPRGLAAWRDGPGDAPGVVAGLSADLPRFALAAAVEALAVGADAPHVSQILRRAVDLAAPFRAELRRLESVLAAARLPPPKPRPPAAERKRQANALRRAFGVYRREQSDERLANNRDWRL